MAKNNNSPQRRQAKKEGIGDTWSTFNRPLMGKNPVDQLNKYSDSDMLNALMDERNRRNKKNK